MLELIDLKNQDFRRSGILNLSRFGCDRRRKGDRIEAKVMGTFIIGRTPAKNNHSSCTTLYTFANVLGFLSKIYTGHKLIISEKRKSRDYQTRSDCFTSKSQYSIAPN
jgi:hypothetical protein